MKRKVITAVLAMGMAGVMTACGGGQTSTASSGGSTEAAAQAVSASAAAAASATDAAAEQEIGTVSEEDALAGVRESPVVSRLTEGGTGAAEGTTESAAALGTGIASAVESDKLAAAGIPGTVISQAGSTGGTAAAAEENTKNSGNYVSNSMIGAYTSNGYESTWYDLKISLPSSYELADRSVLSLNGVSVVDSSNDSDTYDYIRSVVSAGGNTNVFGATNGTTYINVYLEGLGIYDHWEDEGTIAVNTAATAESSIRSSLESAGHSVTDFDYEVDRGIFAGKQHYYCIYSYYVDGIPFYGIEIYVLEGKNDPLMTVDIAGVDPYEISGMDPYFTSCY